MIDISLITTSIDTIWVLIGAALVFFMQAGFAMVETGFTRAKNAGNIIMKNLMDFAIGTVIFWILGFGIMFGTGGNGFIGGFDFFIKGNYGVEGSYTSFSFIIFQTVFCATAATIVSGAMAERTKFSSYCIYSFIISAVIYPISGHWIWGGGWLSELGFHDFAGSTAVHMVGGAAALVGAKILGPRIGKFDKDGKPHAIPGHSLTLGALGAFILWFCWFGFNGCSTVGMTGDSAVNASRIFVTTNLAAAAATVTTMIFTWIKYKKPDVSMTLNGSLAGLVAVTAGCDMVSPVGAVIIGIIAGILVVVGIEFVEKVLKIDDPVGAIGVHFVNGAAGTILTGVFSTSSGILYGFGTQFLFVQIIGVLAVIAWVVITMTVVFIIIKNTVGLRVSVYEETVGLDIEEHGISSSYADFMPSSAIISDMRESNETLLSTNEVTNTETATYEENNINNLTDGKLTKISIICKQSKFEELKNKLNDIGITGITVTQVLGCGMQKGNTELYRGAPIDMTLLPKIKVEVVVAKVPVQTVIDTARKVLHTGKVGDGKIFVYTVDNVIKVRTGEKGYAALQGAED